MNSRNNRRYVVTGEVETAVETTNGNTSDKKEIRLVLRSKEVGLIIGRGRRVLKKLRTDHNSKIVIKKSKTPESVIVLSGGNDSLTALLKDISLILLKTKSTKKDVVSIHAKGDMGDGTVDKKAQFKMLIPNSQAGWVIGKLGHRLKELAFDLQCDLRMFTKICPQSTERIIQATGQPTLISKALVHIMEMLKEYPILEPTKYYDANNYNAKMVVNYGGYKADQEDLRKSRIVKLEENQVLAKGKGLANKRKINGGIRPVDARGPPQFRTNAMITVKLTVPSQMKGVITGKGGSKMRKIRQTSGAEVYIEDLGGSKNIIVAIYGTIPQIATAKSQLQASMNQFRVRRRSI